MAAPRLGLDQEEARKFRDNISRLQNFVLKVDDEKSRNTLSLLLDELLSVESSICWFQHENEGSGLLAYLARLVPLHLDKIMMKLSYVIVNFCVNKNIVLTTPDLHIVVQFLTDSLHQCPSFMHTEILSALCAVCENNTYRIEKFHDVLVGGGGILLQLTDDTTCEEDVVVEAARCLSLLTVIRPNHADCIEVRYVSASFDTFVHLLHRAPHMKMDAHMRHKLLIHCFSGVQNIVLLKRLPNIELGTLFAALRAYMFYGLTNQMLNIPSQLYPTMVTPYDPLTSSKAPKAAAGDAPKKDGNRKTASSPAGKYSQAGNGRGHGKSETSASMDKLTTRDKSRNKKLRKKKGRWQGGEDGEEEVAYRIEEDKTSLSTNVSSQSWSESVADMEVQTWEMTWLRVSSSDSEYSDIEGGKVRQHKTEMVRVRQSALNCFLNIVRVIDKKMMFGFWSSFIPDIRLTASTPQLQQSLFTSILKDQSPRCRMIAVASLTSLLESAKPFLAAAEEGPTNQSSFTPFSVILGSMVKEMHRCLLQALVAENFKSVIIQIIKCLANLVNNVPYHRLNPGLLTRVLKQIRHFYHHKDSNVRTACLTCIGAIVGMKPPLLEVSQLVKTPHNPVGVNRSVISSESLLFRPEDASYLLYPSCTTPQASSNLEKNLNAQPQMPSILKESFDPQTQMSNTQKDNQDTLSNMVIENLDISSNMCSLEDSLVQTRKQNEEKAFQNPTKSPSYITIPYSNDVTNNGLQNELNPQFKNSEINFSENVKNRIILNDLKLKNDLQILKSDLEIGDKFQVLGIDQLKVGTQIDIESRSEQSSGLMTPVLLEGSGMETPVESSLMLQNGTSETSWVIKLCIKNIMDPPCEDNQPRSEASLRYEPLPVRLEALQVMSNLVRNYFPVIRQSFSILKSLVQTCLEDPNHIIKLHGVKVLDELTQALQKDAKDANTSSKHAIPFHQVLEFWLYLLEGPLPMLLNFSSPMYVEGSSNLVRSGACECVANIGEEVFAHLPLPRQMQCVTLVLGLASDEDKLIRSTAIRAVGIYAMYSGLKEDVAFVMDAAKSVLACMRCPSNSVRFKAAWAMANICDSLVNNKDKQVEDFVTNFPDTLLLQLVQCSASSTRDNDKVSCNAARAIGNLLRYMPAHCFQQPEMEKAIEAAVKGLVKNMNSATMKVRWNSCYAASNAFQNTDIPTDRTWVTDILKMLSKVVQNCTNFKVRINAALGLSTPARRAMYGSSETLSHVLVSLMCSLETAENINDFAEYKYKDSLTEHLCGAVLHVISLVDLADITSLSSVVQLKGPSFRTYMEKYIKLALAKPEQNGIHSIEKVKDHLEGLELTVTSDEQRRCLQGLLETCVPETDSADERAPEKTAFQQIYD